MGHEAACCSVCWDPKAGGEELWFKFLYGQLQSVIVQEGDMAMCMLIVACDSLLMLVQGEVILLKRKVGKYAIRLYIYTHIKFPIVV